MCGNQLPAYLVAARRDKRLPKKALLMLLALGDHARPDGWACPSQALLASELEIGQPSVSMTLGVLARLGYVEIRYTPVRGGGAKKRAEYHIVADPRINKIDNINKIDTGIEGIDTGNPAPRIKEIDAPHQFLRIVKELTLDEEDTKDEGPPEAASPGAPTRAPRAPARDQVRAEKPARTKVPSFDGLDPVLWYDTLKAACYDGHGLPVDEQYHRHRLWLRQHYPLDVVIEFFGVKKAEFLARNDHRRVTPKILAEDIEEWDKAVGAREEWLTVRADPRAAAPAPAPPAPPEPAPPPPPPVVVVDEVQLAREAQEAGERAMLLEYLETNEQEQSQWQRALHDRPAVIGAYWQGAILTPPRVNQYRATLTFLGPADAAQAKVSRQQELLARKAATFLPGWPKGQGIPVTIQALEDLLPTAPEVEAIAAG